jgi:hypothetical protein
MQRRFLSFLIPVLIATAIIWIPIGLGEIPQIEEWELLGLFQHQGPVFWVSNGILATHHLRPLLPFWIAIAYLSSSPYLAMHALLALALIVKGVSMAYVINWLTRNHLLAVLTGIVFVVYPADTMQMGFRSLVIIWPVALSMVGVAFWLASATTGRPAWAVVAGLFLLIAGLTYEAAVAMVVAPFVLLFARYGTSSVRVAVGHWRQSAIWISACAIDLAYMGIEATRGRSYQGALLAESPPLRDFPKYLVETGLYRTFLQCWYDAARMLWANITFIPCLLAGGILIGLVVWRPGVARIKCSIGLAARLALGGVFLAALGYAPYLFAISHIHISQRTFLFAAIGGSLVVAAALIIVDWASTPAFVALACALITLGFGSQWEQLATYTDISYRQRAILSGIIEAAPDAGIKDGQWLYITDRSGELLNTWMLRGELLPIALSYLLLRDIRAVVCTEPAGIYSSFAGDQYGVPGHCVPTEKGWVIGKGVRGEFEISRDNAIQLVIDPNGEVSRAEDAQTIPVSQDLSDRIRSNIGCFPCSYVTPEPLSASYRYDFGKYWSLENVAWGDGWTDAGWVMPPSTPVSFAWMAAPRSSLFVRIKPQHSLYHVSVRIFASISLQARDTFRIGINGQDVKVNWITPDTLSGQFDGSILKDGLNEVDLSATPGAPYTISNAIDWVEVSPHE